MLISQSPAAAASLDWQGGSSTSWDVGVSYDWLNGGSVSAYADGADVTFDDSALAFSVQIPGVVQPGSVTVNATNDYTFTGGGSIAGATGVFKTGPGVLTLGNTANAFSGPLVVDNGILRYASSNSLPPTVCVTNSGSLDVDALPTATNKIIVVSGAGYQGQGAIISSSGSVIGATLGSATLLGDTTFGCSTNIRWDVASSAIFNANGYKITKAGAGTVFIYHPTIAANLGDFEVSAGTLGFYYPLNLGNPANTVTVDAGASLNLYGGFPAFSDNIVLTNGTLYNAYVSSTTTGTNIYINPITLRDTNNVINAFAVITLSNGIVGDGGFTKAGANTLFSYGTNTYTGPTVIQSGNVILGANSTLSTNYLEVDGATVDISANPNGLTVADELLAAGGATILGNVNFQPGTTLMVGKSAPGLVNFGSTSLANTTLHTYLGANPSDLSGSVNSLLNITGDLSLSGINTIEVEAFGVLSAGSPYIVAQYSGSLIAGGLSNLQVASVNPAYTFTVVDPATTPGYIEVIPSGSVPTLTWAGGNTNAPTAWDTLTTNWINGENSAPDIFQNGDPVIFDDTGLTNEVTVAGTTASTVTFNNNNSDYVLDGGGTLTGSVELDGSANVIVAMTNLPAISTLNLNNGTLVLDSPAVGRTFTCAAPISGSGTLVQAGSNSVVLANTNIYGYIGYSGVIVVTNGVLQCNIGSTSAGLGNTAVPLYVTNGGTLDLGTGLGTKDLEVAGDGYNGQGALNFSSSSTANSVLARYIDLVGDVTFGSNGRWNASGTFNGNGYKVTKVGTGAFWLYNFSTGTSGPGSGIGDIDVKAGTFYGYGSGAYQIFGDPAKTITVEKGATIGVYQKPYANKNLVLNQATISSGFSAAGAGNYNYWIGQITLNYTNTFSVGTNLWISNNIVGTGGLSKSGAFTLGLVGTPCTYTGPTLITAGTVLIGANVSLASSLISVAAGTKLDLTQPATFSLGTGQTLGGAGTVAGGNLVFGSGSTLYPSLSDASTAKLTVSGTVSLLPGSTNRVVVNKTTTLTSSPVSGAASVAFGGNLTIVKIGSAAWATGDAIQIASATAYSGGFDSITPATPGAGLAWDTSTLSTDGTLRVVAGGVDTTPTNITTQVTNGQLTLSWPVSHLGWRLQVQTNALGAGLGTNWADVPGSGTNTQFALPMNQATGAVFYRMVYP